VVAFKTGVVKAVPVKSKLPAEAASYHLIVPPKLPLLLIVAVEPAQMVAPVAVGAAGPVTVTLKLEVPVQPVPLFQE
jgi:hypothetical protein